MPPLQTNRKMAAVLLDAFFKKTRPPGGRTLSELSTLFYPLLRGETEETMPTKNHGRMAQDMKRELIAIIGEMKDPRVNGGLLTVTRLDVTPDLDQAKVYISVMGREGGPAPVVKALNKASGHVRTEVSRRMHIRKAPRFVFVTDEGAAYAAHINELLEKLDVSGQDSDDAE